MTTELREILVHLIDNPGGGRRRAPVAPKADSPSYHSSSSQKELLPRRERRPLAQQVDDLRNMKIDPLEFEGNLNPNLFIEWM